jgi:hypothetical protein
VGTGLQRSARAGSSRYEQSKRGRHRKANGFEKDDREKDGEPTLRQSGDEGFHSSLLVSNRD